MTPEQRRAGRKRLGWSREVLADKATIPVPSVRQLELGRGPSRGYGPASVRRAFTAAAVVSGAVLGEWVLGE